MVQAISRDQFIMLNEKEQISTLRDAIKLAERKDSKYSYELFQLDGFYIEIRKCLFLNVRKGMRTFDNPDILEPYLIEMNISDFQE